MSTVKTGTHDYTTCSCGHQALAIYPNGKCSMCITKDEVREISFPTVKPTHSTPSVKEVRRKNFERALQARLLRERVS